MPGVVARRRVALPGSDIMVRRKSGEPHPDTTDNPRGSLERIPGRRVTTICDAGQPSACEPKVVQLFRRIVEFGDNVVCQGSSVPLQCQFHPVTSRSDCSRVAPISSGWTGAPTALSLRAISVAGRTCFSRRALMTGQRRLTSDNRARRPALSTYFLLVATLPTSAKGVPSKILSTMASSAGQSGQAATQASTLSSV